MLNIKLKRTTLFVVAVILLLSNLNATKKPDTEIILAEWDGGQLSKQDLNEQISKIPAQYRQQYRIVDGQKRLVNDLVSRELFYAEALRLDMDKDESIVENFKEAERPYYIDKYQDRLIGEIATITEQSKLDYYEEHRSTYVVPPNITIRHLQADDEETAQKIRQELDNNTDFVDILNEYSTNEYSKKRSGRIERIRNNGYIPGIGLDKDLDSLIVNEESNDFVGPFKTDTGYHFFRVIKHLKKSIKPYVDVKESITKKLSYKALNERKEEILENLFNKYNVIIDTVEVNSVNFSNKSTDKDYLSKIIVNSDNKNISFTIEDLYKIYDRIDPQYRQQMDTNNLATNLLKKEIYFSILYEEALKTDLKAEIEKNEKLAEQKKVILMKEAFNRLVSDKVTVTDEQLKEWYEENKKQFKIHANRNARLFLFENQDAADKIHQQVKDLIDARKFLGLRAKYSEEELQAQFDEIVENNCVYTNSKGVLKDVRKKGRITAYGTDKIITKHIWGMQEKDLSEVFETEDNKFAFIRLIDINPESYKELDEVKPRIEKRIMQKNLKEDYDVFYEELKKQYNLKTYLDRLEEILSADELFDLARKAEQRRQYQEAIKYYDTIIEKYSDGKNDVNAQFMKGYLYSEQLNDKEKAIAVYEEFLKKHGDNDLAESAKAMLDDLKGVKKIDSFFIEEN